MEELVKKAKKGDKEAYSQLIQEIKSELYSIAKSKISNEEDIKDIIQETVITGYLKINQLRENKYFKTWIIKILINECNKYYRNNKKEVSINENYVEKLSTDNIESEDTIDDIIENLDKVEKEIFKLYYEDKYTIKEISKILGIKSNTIKSKLKRGRKKIEIKYKKGIITVIILFILMTGVVYGKDIISYIINIFDLSVIGENNKGILERIENEAWYQEVDMDYIELNEGYKIKIKYLTMDEMKMYIVFELESEEQLEKYDRLSVLDLKITDNEGNIICNQGNVNELTSVKLIGWKQIKQDSKTNIQELVYLVSTGFPRMEELNISFSRVILYNDSNPSKYNKEISISENNINIIIDERFIDYNTIEYKEIENNTEIDVSKSILSKTSFYAIITSKELEPNIILEINGNTYECISEFLDINLENNKYNLLIYAKVNDEEISNKIYLINKKNKDKKIELITE